jgi:hypothetical protein
MSGAIPPLPQYAFMAWCSVKAQVQLYLYLYIRKLCWKIIIWNCRNTLNVMKAAHYKQTNFRKQPRFIPPALIIRIAAILFSFMSVWLHSDGVVTSDRRDLTALPFQTSKYPTPIFYLYFVFSVVILLFVHLYRVTRKEENMKEDSIFMSVTVEIRSVSLADRHTNTHR